MVRNIAHHHLKRSINWFVDFVYMCFFYIYIHSKKKWHEFWKRRTFNPSANTEISIDMGVDVLKECDIDLYYVIEDFRHHTLPDSRKIVGSINKKNEIKETFSTYTSYFIQMALFFFIVMYFKPGPKTDDSNPVIVAINTSVIVPSDIYWYHSKISLRKYRTFKEMMNHYGKTINQKCQCPSNHQTLANLWKRPDGTDVDLTFLYHSMCHVSIDQSLHTNEISIVTPKTLNISSYRFVNSDIPHRLLHPDTISIAEFDIPNICVMAITIPQKSDDDHHKKDHDHHPFTFESALNVDIPQGLFIHTSKKTSFSFETNPSLGKNVSQIWANVPTPGQCAILHCPSVTHDLDPESRYEMEHTISLLEEKTRFESIIYKEITVNYYDTSSKYQTWTPNNLMDSIQFQSLFNLMVSPVNLKPVTESDL